MTSFIALIFWLAGLQAGFQSPGRASISGIVLPAEGANPLSGASIVLTPRDPSATATTTAQAARNASALRTRSDAKGEFSLTSIPPGSYTINVEREEYSPQDRFQIGTGGASLSVLNVVAGQRLTGLIVAMNPALAISGTVYDAFGDRLAASTIHALRVKYTPAGRKLIHATSVLSHESGEYRLFHLMPGDYIVSGSYSEQSLKPWEGVIHLTPNLAKPGDGFATAYYPGALNLRDAKLIRLNTTREAVDIDVAFKETAYYKLTVRLLPPAGRTFSNSRVALLPLGADLGVAVDYRLRGAGTSFSVDRLAAGDYVLVALADFPEPDGTTHTSIISDVRPLRMSEDTQVEMTLQEPADLYGRIAVEPNGASSSVLGAMRVRLERVDNAVSQSIISEADFSGGFSLLDVGPGIYDVFVDRMPRNAYLRIAGFLIPDRESTRIRIDSSLPRVFDQISLRSRIDVPLSVTLDTSGGSIQGTVTDFGKQYPGAMVVLVSADAPARLREDRYFTSYSETLGAFQLDGIPPGVYTAYAFQKIVDGIYFDPDFNSRVSSRGTLVTIEAKAKASLNLTLISAEEIARLLP